jgi:hypothetical protein
LIHLAAWESGVTAVLRGEDRMAAMGVSRETYGAGEDVINAEIYARNRGVTASEALARFRTSRERMREAVLGLKDDDLYRPFSSYDPSRPEATDPILNWIAGNTFGHDEEHLNYIRAILDGP